MLSGDISPTRQKHASSTELEVGTNDGHFTPGRERKSGVISIQYGEPGLLGREPHTPYTDERTKIRNIDVVSKQQSRVDAHRYLSWWMIKK